MFLCAENGAGKILLNLLDFEGIRPEASREPRAGPRTSTVRVWDIPSGGTETVCYRRLRRNPSSLLVQRRSRRDISFCPDPNTIIEEMDLLIFIGPKSNPHHSYDSCRWTSTPTRLRRFRSSTLT